MAKANLLIWQGHSVEKQLIFTMLLFAKCDKGMHNGSMADHVKYQFPGVDGVEDYQDDTFLAADHLRSGHCT